MYQLFQQAIATTPAPVARSDLVQCEYPYFWWTVDYHRKQNDDILTDLRRDQNYVEDYDGFVIASFKTTRDRDG